MSRVIYRFFCTKPKIHNKLLLKKITSGIISTCLNKKLKNLDADIKQVDPLLDFGKERVNNNNFCSR